MTEVRIAWFSPLPPVKTGVAACSAELVAALRTRGHPIDTYPEAAAHDFPWMHRQRPYDLIVYQFGNSSHHDYEWPYALRYPGLLVLHDTHLHHARAALLLREKRHDDYRRELRANHPELNPDVAELAIAGFDSRLYYDWPMVRGLVAASRLVAVHGEAARRELVERLSDDRYPMSDDRYPMSDARCAYADRIVSIRLGHGQPVSPEQEADARAKIRARYGIAQDAIVFGVFGGLTPEKRLPQILAAFRAVLPHAPTARLLLVGAPAAHYDVRQDISGTDVVVTGYVEDAELTDHIAAVDVSLNLRWPTARETSGPWLRALAAGKATVIGDLVHLADVPSLDPRTWTVNAATDVRYPMSDEISAGDGLPSGRRSLISSVIGHRSSDIGYRTSDIGPAVAVAVDILDEDHSLRLAMRRLATDADLRAALGRAAREHWQREHTVEGMADDYERMMKGVRTVQGVRGVQGVSDGGETLRALLEPFGIESPFDIGRSGP